LMTYPWDLLYANAKQIAVDYDALGCTGEKAGMIYEGVHMVNPGRVTVGPGAVIKPGVVIDAEKGPVWIDAEAVIYPQAVLEGPCYVGRGTWISMGAKIYEGVSIAAWCKIGGEVEECVIHACTNKRHDGFLGHSVLGEWVNIGADTNTSNLKNNYSDVSCVIQGKTVSSGRMFMGATIGDHSKLGINTMLNTGVVIGFSANVFGSDFPPKSIPSYVWGGAAGFAEYTIEKAIENAVKCVRRKEMVISPSEQQVFRDIFDMTRSEREPVV